METSQIPNEIREKFLQLPKSIQDIILNSNWEDQARKIVEKFNLRIDQGSFIETEVMLVMFGFVPPEEFKDDLVEKAGIDRKIATEVEKDVSENIFKLIKDKIRVITTDDNDEENSHKKNPSNPTPKEISQNEEKSKDAKSTPSAKENEIVNDKLNNADVEKRIEKDPYREPIE